MVVCTNLSRKAQHAQGCVSRVTLGSLGNVMVSTLTPNARHVGSISAQGAIFPQCHQSHDTGCCDDVPLETTCCLVVESTLWGNRLAVCM